VHVPAPKFAPGDVDHAPPGEERRCCRRRRRRLLCGRSGGLEDALHDLSKGDVGQSGDHEDGSGLVTGSIPADVPQVLDHLGAGIRGVAAENDRRRLPAGCGSCPRAKDGGFGYGGVADQDGFDLGGGEPLVGHRPVGLNYVG